jgi:WD40 repeat protein
MVWDVPAWHRQPAEREARGLVLHVEGERSTLVTLSRHASARLRDPLSGAELGRLHLETGEDYPYTDTAGGCLAAGTVGGRLMLATGGTADGVSLWDAEAGSVALVLKGLRKARAAAFGAAGDRELVVAGGGWDAAAVWDAVTGERLAVLHDGPASGAWEVRAIAVATVRRRTVVACGGRADITMWNGLTGAYLRSLPLDGDGTGLVMCPLGARVVLAAPLYGGVCLWDAGNGKRLAALPGLGAPVTCLAGLPYRDRLLLVTGDDEGTVALWEWDGVSEHGTMLGVLALFARTVHAVAVGMVAGAPHVFAQSYTDRVTAGRPDPVLLSGR